MVGESTHREKLKLFLRLVKNAEVYNIGHLGFLFSCKTTKITIMENYCKATIEMPESGTIPVMKWIKQHNTPELFHTCFIYGKSTGLIVSSESESPRIRELFRVKEPFVQDGMYRITISFCGQEPAWYFFIDGHYYFATIY